jgi:two-component system NtrC family sensor kinase
VEPAANLNTETKGKLLLVDDEENILRSLRRVLRRGDWEIETAPDAESALAICERFQPAVVVSDFRMPGMNGVDFLERVKHLMPHAQRIMLTGQADQQAIEEAINRSQVFRFISKPWNDAQVLLTVKSAFEQHYLVTDNARLAELTREQNINLRQLNADLEQRVQQRTQMLSRAKREWELSFDTLDNPLAIVSTDDLTLRRGNRAFAKMAGCEVLELNKGLKCHEVLFNRGDQCAGCTVHGAKSTQGKFEIVHFGHTYLADVYPMEDDVAVCHYRDVTEDRALARRMLETEKMIAIGNLAGGVAHEINNPIGGILAFSQLMKRDQGRSKADLEALDLIEESALRCKRIVESLLKFSRTSRVEDRRPFDLSPCVEDAARLFKAQLKNHPKARLEVKAHSAPLEVYGDPGQLGQVVLNLLQNGLQALPAFEGELTVETGLTPHGERFLRVSDTGCGIPEQNLARIFEPHFTTKPPGEGTGLGLSIAYRIVEDHGGRFTVTSAPGRGSSFEVQIPVRLEAT